MARKPIDQGGLATPKNKNDGKLRKAGLFKVSSDGTVDLGTGNQTIKESILANNSDSIFLLNPSSYSETKSSNWKAESVPGQSDPIYQWVSGNSRTLSFETLVTKDTSKLGQQKEPSREDQLKQSLKNGAQNVVGNIASQLAGVTVPPVADLFPTESSGEELSIASQLAYYRSLLYPTYDDNYKSLTHSPPLVILISGQTFSSSPIADGGSVIDRNVNLEHTPVWMVSDLNINVTKQLPNLNPMEAVVNFTLIEYTIASISSGMVKFVPNADSNSTNAIPTFNLA